MPSMVAPAARGGQGGGGDIFPVVPPGKGRAIQPDPIPLTVRSRDANLLDIDPRPGSARTLFFFSGREKRELSGQKRPGKGQDPGGGSVDHSRVRFPLIHEQAPLGRGVGVKIRITVQMVLGDVEQNRYRGPEPLHGVELKTAHFQDQGVHGLRIEQMPHEGGADVAAHKDPLARGDEHLSDELGGGGLAVGPGDGHHGGGDKTGGQLHFPDYGNAPVPGPIQGGRGMGDPGAQDNEVGPVKERLWVAAQGQVDPQLPQLLQGLRRCRRRGGVGGRDPGAVRCSEPHRSLSGTSKTHDEKLSTLEIHFH